MSNIMVLITAAFNNRPTKGFPTKTKYGDGDDDDNDAPDAGGFGGRSDAEEDRADNSDHHQHHMPDVFQ